MVPEPFELLGSVKSWGIKIIKPLYLSELQKFDMLVVIQISSVFESIISNAMSAPLVFDVCTKISATVR